MPLPETGMTATELAAHAGVTVAQAMRIWRAFGFAESGDDPIYTSEDVEALRRLTRTMESAEIDFDTTVNLTRAVGQTLTRLTDWEVSGLVTHLAETNQGADQADVLKKAGEVIAALSEPYEELLLYVWRRHTNASLARLEAQSMESSIGTSEMSVGFADIVSFTALSNTLTQDKIGDLVEVFESRCADVVSLHGGRVIKSMGDAVLFVNDDPIRAYDTAAGIIQVVGRDSRMPDVRVGLSSGSVVMRMGDVFGPPVNMASRLTGVARRNHIITDEATAALLPSSEFESRQLPARPVRGFGVISPVAVSRR